MFNLTILNPKHVLYEGEAESVFLPGDKGEFEVLTYHAPIVSLLTAGQVVVDWETAIAIKKGMMKYYNNDCVVLVEE
jgi:F-type H+-transporting ATPase subunit epsilon